MAGHSIGGFQTPDFIKVTVFDSDRKQIVPTKLITEVEVANETFVERFQGQPVIRWESKNMKSHVVTEETMEELMRKLVLWSTY